MPTITKPQGIKAVARLLGVRYRWWHSKRTIARKVVKKMGEAWPFERLLSDAFAASVQPRHLVREEFIEFDEAPYYIENGVAIETPGPTTRTKVWRFYYSDGDFEQITRRGLPV